MKHRNITGAILFFCLLFGQAVTAQAQDALIYPKPEGIFFHSRDSSTRVQFGVRLQSRMDVSSRNKENFAPSDVQFRIRRLRLKAAGTVIDPRLSFKLELGFSSNDLREALGNSANILYDAYIQYDLQPSLSLSFGQFKLPGNRQYLMSDQAQALIDASIVSSEYSLDRDIGLLLEYERSIGQVGLRYFGSLTNGEGRNILTSPQPLNREELNLAFSQRLEFLPLGWFEDGGDYFEGDLLREESPKLSIGIGYHYNNDAIRESGVSGSLLFDNRDINSFFSDFIFKYRGWTLLGEYINTYANEPVTLLPVSLVEKEVSVVNAGSGYMAQGGYVWPNMWGLSVRYASTTPDITVTNYYHPTTELVAGLSKYIRGHRIKVQSDIGYMTDESLPENMEEYWQWRVQMELAL